jgi:hypothetical protein
MPPFISPLATNKRRSIDRLRLMERLESVWKEVLPERVGYGRRGYSTAGRPASDMDTTLTMASGDGLARKVSSTDRLWSGQIFLGLSQRSTSSVLCSLLERVPSDSGLKVRLS